LFIAAKKVCQTGVGQYLPSLADQVQGEVVDLVRAQGRLVLVAKVVLSCLLSLYYP
jgi:hypothetical protein